MINAIIVDDERKARQTLSLLLDMYCKDVSILAEFDNIQAAEDFLKQVKPDLLFLDVEMPDGTGLELANKLPDLSGKIIFITAHPHYAVKAIKVEAFDYLLKPVDIQELQNTIKRFRDKQNQLKIATRQGQTEPRLAIPTKQGILYIKQHEIVRIEASGSYAFIYTDTVKHLVSKNLSELTELLNEELFFRIHNSHIVNLKKIKNFIKGDNYSIIMQDDSKVDVSRRKKDEFLKLMAGK